MKKLALCIAATAALSSSAFAADMAVKAPPPPLLEPGFNWTGFYIGVNAGGDWGRSNTDSPIANGICPTCYIPSVIADINAQRFQTINGSGFTGGAQAGYNYQVNRFVLGVEADINAFRVAGATTTSAFFTAFPGGAGSIPPTYTNSVSTNWLFTGRGRLALRPIIGCFTGPVVWPSRTFLTDIPMRKECSAARPRLPKPQVLPLPRLATRLEQALNMHGAELGPLRQNIST